MPSTVDTVLNSNGATVWPFQRKTFYANGLFWAFYYTGDLGTMAYSTSTDGTTWAWRTSVRAAVTGSCFSVWFDGTYIHYAYASMVAAEDLVYRRGIPNSDGTITWSAVEQTAVAGAAGVKYHNPFVSVDSNGYVWIGYRQFDGTDNWPYVSKSGNNDGTWGATPAGFPYKLSALADWGWVVSVTPLTAGKMFAVYVRDDETINAQCWDGSAWQAEVTTTSEIMNAWHSAVAEGDDVHLVFLEHWPPFPILYVKYTYSTNSFGTETTLQAESSGTSAPVISIDTITNDLYVFWGVCTYPPPAFFPADGHIYYCKYTASTSTWETAVDWIDESTTGLTDSDRITCFYQVYDHKIGLIYLTKYSSPRYVRFDFLVIVNKQAAQMMMHDGL